jgi:hypothetical protein
VRQVFDNRGVVNAFVEGKQQSGRNAKNSLHFEGDVLYSYNEPIAVRTPQVNANNYPIYVVNTDWFSATTRRHANLAKRLLELTTALVNVPFSELRIMRRLGMLAIPQV